VLDLCCGYGRHTLALHELGCDVCGLDLSAELLAQARRTPELAPIRDVLVRGDARVLPFRTASFDSVVVLFSSFGYFEPDGDARMLDEIVRVLAPAGRVVLDLMNPARVRAGLVPHSRTQRGALAIDERRRLEAGGTRVVKEVEVVDADGRARRWVERVHLYDPPAIESLLASRGLRRRASHGDFDGAPLSADSPRQLVLAERV
jgi:SAM-dependent methyltransferase